MRPECLRTSIVSRLTPSAPSVDPTMKCNTHWKEILTNNIYLFKTHSKLYYLQNFFSQSLITSNKLKTYNIRHTELPYIIYNQFINTNVLKNSCYMSFQSYTRNHKCVFYTKLFEHCYNLPSLQGIFVQEIHIFTVLIRR